MTAVVASPGQFRWIAGAAMLVFAFADLFGARPASAQQPANVAVKVLRYAEHLVAKYDMDGDGRLQADEWNRMSGNPSAADQNGDGVILIQELAQHTADYGARRRIRLMPALSDTGIQLPSLLRGDLADGRGAAAGDVSGPGARDAPNHPDGTPVSSDARETPVRKYTVRGSRVGEGLPNWFLQLDRDGDGQLTQAEFAPRATPAAMQEFAAYDRNGDGIITSREISTRPAESTTGPRADESEESPQEALPSTPGQISD